MPSTTPISGLPYPNLGESADGPDAIGDLAVAIDPQLSRAQPRTGAQITAIASPRIGQLVVNTDTGRVLYWNGSIWRPIGGGASGATVIPATSVSQTAVTMSMFVGVGFEEVMMTSGFLPASAGFGFTLLVTADPTAAQGSSPVPNGSSSGQGSYFAPSSATDYFATPWRMSSGNASTLQLRNARLDSDGYVRFEVYLGAASTLVTAATRFNWRAR